jgi:sugar/nucleoside kinase (ribokinase family)
MPGIIAIGEILVEIMRPEAGQPLDQPGEFRGPYASGAPAIFAVAAARLGLDTAFIGAAGEDAFGRLLKERLGEEGVDFRGLQFPPGYATGVAFVAYEQDGSREFVFHIRHAAAGQIQANEIPAVLFEGVKWLHISGSTLALNEGCRAACERALELALAQGGKISLDPNLRPELMPLDNFREVLTPFLQAADLILPTAGEARLLTGEDDDARAASALRAKTGAITVLKRGPQGCTVFHHADQFEASGYPIEEIDPTGAGDCFSAAFIAALEAGWSLEKTAKFANAAGALAVTRMGPMEGAPTWEQTAGML